jgi:hypothetical protein
MLCYDWEERGYVVVWKMEPESYLGQGDLPAREVIGAHYAAILVQLMFQDAGLAPPHIAYLILETRWRQIAPAGGIALHGFPAIPSGTPYHPAWRVAYNPRHYLFEARLGPKPALQPWSGLRPSDYDLGIRFPDHAPDSHPLRLALSVRDGFERSGQARAFAARPGRATRVQDLVQSYAYRPARIADVLALWAGHQKPLGPFLPAGSTRYRQLRDGFAFLSHQHDRDSVLSVVAFGYPVGIAQFEVAAKAGVAGPKTSPVGVIPMLCYDWHAGGFVVCSELGLDSSRDGKLVAYTDAIAAHYLAFLLQRMHDELKLPPPRIAYLILWSVPRAENFGFHRIDYDPRRFLVEALPDRYSMISPPSELDFLEEGGEDVR